MDQEQKDRLQRLAKKSVIQEEDCYRVKFDRPVTGADLSLRFDSREAAEHSAFNALINHYEIRERKLDL